MNKDFIASIIFAVGCFIFFVLNVPQYDLLLDTQDALKSEQALLADRKEMRDNFTAMFNQLQQRANDTAKLAVVLPERPGNDQVVMDIQQAVAENGLQLGSLTISPMKETGLNPYKKISVSIETIGSPSSIPGLLRQLESSLRVYDITELSISKSTSVSSGQTGFNITIKLYAYYSSN